MAEDFVSPGLVQRLLGRTSSLPSYSPRPTPQVLETSPREDYGALALEAAQAGSLGGSVGGSAARVPAKTAVGYSDFSSEVDRWPLVYRGIGGSPEGVPVADPLDTGRGRHGPVAFASRNPLVAASYAGTFTEKALAESAIEAEEAAREYRRTIAEGNTAGSPEYHPIRRLEGMNINREIQARDLPGLKGNRVFPLRIDPDSIVGDFWQNEPASRRTIGVRWDQANQGLPPGKALVARGITGTGGWNLPELRAEGVGLRSFTPADEYAFKSGAAIRSGDVLTAEDIPPAIRRAADRVSGDFTFDRTSSLAEDPIIPKRVLEKAKEEGLYDISPFARRRAMRPLEELSSAKLDEFFEEMSKDPAFKPSTKEKLKTFLTKRGKGLVKGMLSPVSILTDATLGAGVGAGSALLGYESARPRSAGIFTPQNPRYEGVVDPAMIERLSEQGEAENEIERQRLIRQYNALGYDIDPNTRLRDLRR